MIKVLIELLNTEALGPGQSRIARACMRVKHPKIRDALLLFIQKNITHRALSFALQAIGEQVRK